MRAAVIVAVVMALGGIAEAQPWAQGVSEAQKTEAKARLDEGNDLFLAQKYKEALDKYTQAVAAWDHPAIRFNMVRALIQLDRAVEASDNLQLALQYGQDPLDEVMYREALNYQKLLANQIGDLEITCSQPGAKLTLDGQPLLTCPGKEKRRVAPGSHSVVATKEGFLTKELRVVVVGGKAETADIKLVPLDKAAKVVHRWPTWRPWLVFGASLAVVGAGTLLQLDAGAMMNDYDTRVATACAINGCDLGDGSPTSTELNEMYDRARRRSVVAVSVISVGVAGAVVGGVMLWMNRGRTVYEDPIKPSVGVVPTSDGGMVTLSGGF